MIINRKAFIVGIKSTSLNSNEKKFLRNYKPWGIILFSRNISSIDQVKNLTKQIRKIFNDKNYPILIDQEGGRINRLKKFFNTDVFTSKFFGDLYLKDKKKFNDYYNVFINVTSNLLKQIGININTVPVLDIRKKGSSSIIGDRSFSTKKNVVNNVGKICIQSFHKNKIGTVIKHIPGHGLAKVDSHFMTPIIKKKISFLINNDFAVFKDKNSFLAMTAHITYTDIDKFNTATHSKKVINLIRKKIKFHNLLITDDISMKSLKYSLKENIVRSFKAGCNLVLHCNGNFKEMLIVGKNSPFVDQFIIKKTSQFYKILS